jgi:hypothetical protein
MINIAKTKKNVTWIFILIATVSSLIAGVIHYVWFFDVTTNRILIVWLIAFVILFCQYIYLLPGKVGGSGSGTIRWNFKQIGKVVIIALLGIIIYVSVLFYYSS